MRLVVARGGRVPRPSSSPPPCISLYVYMHKCMCTCVYVYVYTDAVVRGKESPEMSRGDYTSPVASSREIDR